MLEPPPRRAHQYDSLHIEIAGIPAENGKCRVETQLKISFHLKDAQGQHVGDWKQLRLPHSLIAKEKHRMEKFNGRNRQLQDSEILTLEARLVCDHDMSKVLYTCDNCIGRERKRAHRRKESQKLTGPLASIPVFGLLSSKHQPTNPNEPPPTPTDPAEYLAWERSRIMVFSSTEYVDFAEGQCMLPTRITCYCRHHNEKVGFRIIFTLKDSTGAIVASVLTNAVMMMDDHKSGKRTTPGQPKLTKGAASGTPAKALKATAPTENGPVQQTNEMKEETEDMEQDDDDDDDSAIDLETGNRRHVKSESLSQAEALELMAGDTLSPLTNKIGGKRRVEDESAMTGIQTSQTLDALRGPFRRKTSHDLVQSTAPPFTPASLSFTPISAQPDITSIPSPFMPGSPFASEDSQNVFTPSFSQALANGRLMESKDIDSIFLPTSSTGDHAMDQERLNAESVSMMETFTTLDESMSSPPETTFMAAVSGSLANNPLLTMDTSLPFASLATPTSAGLTFTPALHTAASTNTANNTLPMGFPPKKPGTMASSFLDASQMQEFQNFTRQSLLQQQQQQVVNLLQQGLSQSPAVQLQQQNQHQSLAWNKLSQDGNNNNINNRDPLWKLKAALANTTNPSSSAFIQIPASLPENGIGATNANGTLATSSQQQQPASPTDPTPKKRGRPRKTPTGALSEASSPVLSAAIPSRGTIPPQSPSSSPAPMSGGLGGIGGFGHNLSASATAAQILLLQKKQQEQHQQQLQQQHQQAILARQKPRVQKVVPAKGPTQGGAQITLLGNGFYPGMVPTFDGIPAQDVQYYGPETVICRLPPRAFPGTVIVRAQQSNVLTGLKGAAANGGSSSNGDAAGQGGEKDGRANGVGSNDMLATMSQLFGGSNGTSTSLVLGGMGSEDEVGVLFEYEEDQGDRDLIALALQVLGMKMNGRVEPPHQVAMRIMDTAIATSAGLIGSDTSSQALAVNGGTNGLGANHSTSVVNGQKSLTGSSMTLQQQQQQAFLSQQQQQQQQQQLQLRSSLQNGIEFMPNMLTPQQQQQQQQALLRHQQLQQLQLLQLQQQQQQQKALFQQQHQQHQRASSLHELANGFIGSPFLNGDGTSDASQQQQQQQHHGRSGSLSIPNGASGGSPSLPATPMTPASPLVSDHGGFSNELDSHRGSISANGTSTTPTPGMERNGWPN
ncbi:hypothetical protein BGW41_000497 [Actinomortierella wolfii]|nr:hypothetical protein BGW41_000497 [Actinomortierella wolfii]